MRPVPLEHFLWAGRAIHKIVDSKSQFLTEGYKAANEATRSKQDKEREANGLPPVQRTGGRGGVPPQSARGAKALPTGRGAPFTKVGAGRTHVNRGGGVNGAPVPAPNRGRGGGGGFGPQRASHQLDQNVWTHLVGFLNTAKLLPVVCFVFSKKRCEEYASNLSKDLCDAKERSEIHIVWERALTRLKGEWELGKGWDGRGRALMLDRHG
jgi:antiviral helicase SKI2